MKYVRIRVKEVLAKGVGTKVFLSDKASFMPLSFWKRFEKVTRSGLNFNNDDHIKLVGEYLKKKGYKYVGVKGGTYGSHTWTKSGNSWRLTGDAEMSQHGIDIELEQWVGEG